MIRGGAAASFPPPLSRRASERGRTSHFITTRYTSSGEPIQVATQYAYDRLAAVGLDVAFHEWVDGRNVIADTLDHLNLSYLTSYVKAVVGTVAHLAVPVPKTFADGFEAGDTSAWGATVP